MPKYNALFEQQIRKEIRLIVAIEPTISMLALGQYLAKKGLKGYTGQPFDVTYLTRLTHKVAQESLVNVDRAKLKDRLAGMRERHAAAFDRLFKIAFWKWEYLDEGISKPEIKDQVKALETILKMDQALLQTEMDAGVFERKLGTLKVDHEHTMKVDDDEAEGVMRALRNYGIVKPANIIEQPELPRPEQSP